LESGFGLLRVLGAGGDSNNPVWHLAAYRELFMDVDSAEEAAKQARHLLTLEIPHVALTNRAFESTQVAKVTSAPLDNSETNPLNEWHADPKHQIHDRSIRLLLGLR
ncbi:MAG TPA: hypothetical protein VEV84_08045, partial [Pyrinomonadaceae bacterium]|nr:hypothetical protein [Pyrinomonadaceae bacterium]